MPSLTEPATAPTPASFVSRPHLAYLDSLRGLAACYVIAFHALLQNNLNTGSISGVGHWLLRAVQYGHFAVDLFIVLSGFCLMLPVARGNGSLRGGAWQFLLRRARRILPTYYFALLLSLLLIYTVIGHKTGTLWDTTLPVTPAGLWAHLLLIQDLFPTLLLQINHALWSISVEWRIYFVFPLLVFGWQRWGALQTTALAVAGAYLLLGILQRTSLAADPVAIVGIMPQYIGLFALGMLGAGIAFSREAALTHWREKIPWTAVFGVSALFALLLTKLRLWHGSVLPIAYTDLPVGCAAAALCVVGSRTESRLSRILACKPLAFIGTFAYSIYLLHAPLLQLLWQYVWNPLHLNFVQGFYAQCFVGIPLIVSVSYLFFLCCERPFLTSRTRSVSPTRSI